MIDYSIKNNLLVIGSQQVVFDHPIRTVLEKDHVLMVLLLKNELKEIRQYYNSRNIFGVSAEGEILWQVEAPTKDPVDLYTQMNEVEGKIIAGSWSCFLCELDPGTGKIIDKEFTK